MNEILIITGWKVDFICSAALIYSKHHNSDISGMSKRGLPEYFKKLSQDKNSRYRTIYILGIPLMEDEQKLLAACKRLHKKRTEIIWLCSYPLPHRCPAGLEKFIQIPSAVKEIPLWQLTAKEQKISRKTSLCYTLEKVVTFAESQTGDDASAERADLIDAGMSRFRRFQDMDTLIDIIRFIAENRPLEHKEKALVKEYRRFGKRELKGRSDAITSIKRTVKKIGTEGNCGVLITGETGTGKETVANLIHGYSPRSEEPFIAFNCADLSPQLIESRLFGHEKGAFTGADKLRHGAFELANGGTLFLDEVAELPLSAQAGLLRVLQEGRFCRLGGEDEVQTDVRIIAATNRNISDMIINREFREDLFYRLNIVNIHIPPLRERKIDIKYIAESYMFARKHRQLNQQQLKVLENYSWPGNVRELQNFLERSIVLQEYDYTKLLTEYKKSFAISANTESDLLDDARRQKVRQVYEKYNNNKTHAAKALGVTINTLKKYLD